MSSNERGVFKKFRLTSFAVDHPTSVLVLTFILIVMGMRAYVTVPKESFPEIEIPNVIINTIYSGVSPKDIETLVTRPIEDELTGISDVKEITSTSLEGYSTITVEFNSGVEMTEALQQVREKVDLAKPELPSAAEEPMISEINFAEFPIVQVNVAGPYDLVRLREVAEDLQDEIELIPSVLEVRLAGGLEREVQIDVDLPKLKFYNIGFQGVIDAIRDENITVPGGRIDVGGLKYLVRVPGEFTETDPIGDIVVKTQGGRPIYVRDVATVDFGFKETDTYARLNGNSVVSLSVVKRSGQNIIETVEAVRAVVAEESETFPPGTRVELTSDQSKDIRMMVSSLENNIISGLLLVVAVLLFFLGVRTASFVGTAIPLSMLISFSVIQLAGMTMNMVVLFSLILALGMLVDNAIVVVENIYRYRERGYDKEEAAKLATGEVALPIIASTATTLAAFFPMTFWPGMIGGFMSYLPKTLIITLASSLFVGLVIIPTLCSLFLDTEDTAPVPMTRAAKLTLGAVATMVAVIGLMVSWVPTTLLMLTALLAVLLYRAVVRPVQTWFMGTALPAMIVRYERTLDWALRHRAAVVGIAVMTLIGSIAIFGRFNAGVEQFPEDIPPVALYVQVKAPVGTNIEMTDGIVQELERRVNALPGAVDFTSVVATVGSQISGDPSGGQQNQTHLATVSVNLADDQERQFDPFETMELMRSTIADGIAGADISVEKPADGPSGGPAISIDIIGEDADRLKILGDEALDILENSPVFRKLDRLKSNLSDQQPELVINVNRERAAMYGLNTRDIGFTVRNAINGAEASTYRDGKDEYDITVRLAEEYRQDLSALGDLTVMHEGQQIPLSSVATWTTGVGYSDVNRKDQDRVVTISSEVRAPHNATEVRNEVDSALADFQAALPPGYRAEFTGQQQDMEESQAFLAGAFLMALFLIAFILVSQFDSVFKPFIILTSVFMSTVGVLIGLVVFRMPFGIIMTGVGVISLAGVVVNNAIVLIDYIGILRERDGLSLHEALLKAGVTRFRPVVLTAITTVLGLVPLAIGLNFDFLGLYRELQPDLYWGGTQAAWWGPMAIAVIAGLTFATLLTLILVPVLYSLFDGLEVVLVKNFTKAGVEAEEAEAVREGPESEGLGEPVPV